MIQHNNTRDRKNNPQKKRVFILSKKKEDSLTGEKKPKDKDGGELKEKFTFMKNPFG